MLAEKGVAKQVGLPLPQNRMGSHDPGGGDSPEKVALRLKGLFFKKKKNTNPNSSNI